MVDQGLLEAALVVTVEVATLVRPRVTMRVKQVLGSLGLIA